MQPICTYKVSSHSSKPSHAYPGIRLPSEFKTIVGRNAHVYQTQNDGKLAFLIKIDDKFGNYVATSPELKCEDRVSDLEERIEELEQLILLMRSL